MSDQPYLVPIEVNQVVAPMPAKSAWKDWIGIVASIGCAIHCAAMPFVIAFLPALGLSFLADESFHKWMALACFLIALAAFVPGWRKHRRLAPAIIAFAGITAITTAAFGMTGDCCAACEATTASAAEATTVSAAEATTVLANAPTTASASESTTVLVTESPAACTEACCEHCAAENDAEEQGQQQAILAATMSNANILNIPTWLTPWVTPIGGLLLVCGHLLNRRYGCLCGCCETEAVNT
ncbi:MAG: MerC domain-containing protein [Rubripirellula sp.]|nr:MerC domain-containing protein [Rubripirellula sp.]